MSDAFDSDDCALMVRALSRAYAELDGGKFYDGRGEEETKAILTQAIMESAGRGERNERKLVAYALSCLEQVHR